MIYCDTFKTNILGTRIVNNNLLIATEKGVYKFMGDSKYKKVKFKDPNKITNSPLHWIEEIL